MSHRTKATERDTPLPPSRPAWCGVCDASTRLLDDATAGQQPIVRRCPTCHPLEARHG